ncbi:MAG: ATPase [Ignavibacteria bacterium GWF2_33_9]|nr:MAG: ATPase [Ignavibacteria bacterium GWF2_33_9]
MKAIIVENIVKTYQKVLAVNNVSFEVEYGEIFGLIGPDGAGKTSIMRILTTLILPDSGAFQVDNFDGFKQFKEIRKSIGYMPGRFSLYPDLTVRENINLFASIFNTSIAENYHLVKDIYSQLEPFENRPAGKLSGGMKQKLALSCALIHKPNILFLDEPTTGVDALSRVEFWDMLKKLKYDGMAILVSTPYMDEVSKCDRIGLMQNGNMLKIESPKNIEEDFRRNLYAIKTEQTYLVLETLKSYKYTDTVFAFGESIHYTDKRIEDVSVSIFDYLYKNHLNIEIKQIRANVEDCFMDLMRNSNE